MAGPAASPATIEGTLLAHRKLLAALVAAVLDDAGGSGRARLERLIAPDAVPADQQEDPGAVPTEAFAIAAAVAEELRLVGEEVRRLRAASGGPG